jgi:hypothetical protein
VLVGIDTDASNPEIEFPHRDRVTRLMEGKQLVIPRRVDGFLVRNCDLLLFDMNGTEPSANA